jgi:hypothetical protein
MSYTLFSEKVRVARKARPCVWCGERIAAGDQYKNVTFVYDGDFQNQHFHPECHADMTACANDDGGFFEWVTGDNPRPKLTTP